MSDRESTRRESAAAAVFLAALLLFALCRAALADQQNDPRPVTWTKCSGTITTGGTAQLLSLGHGPLRGFYIQNPTTATSESLYFDPNGTATATSAEMQQGGPPLFFGPGTIFFGNTPSVLAATTAHPFTCFYAQ